MQLLERDGLTAEQVTSVLQTDALHVEFGCDLLAADLSFVEDISADVEAWSVQWNLHATVHRSLTMTTVRDLAWGTDLVRPFLVLTDTLTGLSARFNVGVFCLTTPEDVFGDDPRSYRVTGYDRLYLLDREGGDAYRAASGTGYLAKVRQVISDAGLTGVLLDGTAEATLLPADMLWPLLTDGRPTTWLRIVNDLLAAVNYRGVYTDENGFYRSGPYVEPSARTAEFAFDADDPTTTLVGQARSRVQDRWKAPNRWVFVRRNMPGTPPSEPVEGAGIYTVPNLTGELTRARTVVLDAADQAALVAQGDRIVASDRRVATALKVETAPFPAAGHADVFAYTDMEMGGTVKVQAVRWQMPHDGDMNWDFEVVA